MGRKITLIICIFNLGLVVLLAITYFRPKSPAFRGNGLGPAQQTSAQLSDNELWQLARESHSISEVVGYLNRLEAFDEVGKRVIERLDSGAFSKSEDWIFYQGLFAAYASRADSPNDLAPLKEAFQPNSTPLTLKSHLLVIYIENCARLGQIEDCYDLIDAAYLAGNSLRGLSLKADQYLLDKGHSNQDREQILVSRCLDILTDSNQLESNQYDAISVLKQNSSHLYDVPLRLIFENARSERIQNSLLRLVLKTDKQERDWIAAIEPLSPEQESLLIQIIRTATDE